MTRLLTLFFVCAAFQLSAQAPTGPGGVGTASNNFLFLRSDVGTSTTTTGVGVATWSDQSGNGNNFTRAANQPTYQAAQLNGLPSIRFVSGSSNYMQGPSVFPVNSDYTKFVVGKISATTTNNNFFSGTSGHAIYTAGTTFPRLFQNGNQYAVSTIAMAVNTSSYILTGTFKTSTLFGEIFVNGTSGKTGTAPVANTDNTMFVGAFGAGANLLNGDLNEVIGYNYQVNTAQRIIIENYLSAKYNLPLTSNDIYVQDDPANGNYDFDVAGIGRVNATNFHSDAQGTSFIRMLNPTDLGDGEYYIWGHDGAPALATNTADVPVGVTARFARVWRATETGGNGDVGNVDVQIDVTGLADFAGLSVCDGASAIRLLVDTNNNGLFADQTPISGATNIGGNVYRFANLSVLTDGRRFTIAIVASSTGPGGVGNKASNFLFLRGDAGTSTTTNNTALATWSDQSGNANNATAAGAAQPTYLTNQLNGFPTVDFNGTSQFMVSPSNFPINSDFTKFVVGKIKSTTPFNNYFSGNGGHALFMNMGSLNPQLFQNGSIYLVSSQAMVLNQYSVLSNTFVNSTKVGEVFVSGLSGGSAAASAVNTDAAIQIGGFANGSLLDGDMTEVIGYNFKLNSAQRIIVENYLAAKYGLSLAAATDKYTRDNAGLNYDYDVAGIGRVDVNNLHRDARGTGQVRVSNPTDLNDGEFFIWGHNNGSLLVTNSTDVPTGIQVRMTRVWSVSEPSGDVGGIDVQFDLTGQNTVVASDLRLLIDHDGDGIFNEVGTVVVSGATALSCNNYSFTVVSSLDNNVGFTLGSVNASQTPLPISLTSFVGRMENNKAILNWVTASELNNDHFEVERSMDGESFTTVTKVTGGGTSTSTINYQAVDIYPPTGRIYYRLKQVDFDGKFTYSKLISLENNSAELKLIVSPNPSSKNGVVRIKLLSPGGISIEGISFSLHDVFGRSTPITIVRNGESDWELRMAQPENSVEGVFILRMSIASIGKTFADRIVIAK